MEPQERRSSMSAPEIKIFNLQSSKTLRRFYRGVSNVFKKDKKGSCRTWFNPEELASQKSEWLKNQQGKALRWPEHLFEHLVIVGLPPNADTKEIYNEIKQEQESKKNIGIGSSSSKQGDLLNHSTPKPSYTPQLLFQYPDDKPLHMSPEELIPFCFPYGVTPKVLKKTRNMSSLNEVVYGQQHIVNSEQSFVFYQKGDNYLPMFGICYYVNQMVSSPPGLIKDQYSDLRKADINTDLVSAPRCYCLLSRYPFFDLHFQVLNLIIGLERLDSISEFMKEVVNHPPQPCLSNRLGFASVIPSPTSNCHRFSLPVASTSSSSYSPAATPPSYARSVDGEYCSHSTVSQRHARSDRSNSYVEELEQQQGARYKLKSCFHIQDSVTSMMGMRGVRSKEVYENSYVNITSGISAGVKERTVSEGEQSSSNDGGSTSDFGISFPSPIFNKLKQLQEGESQTDSGECSSGIEISPLDLSNNPSPFSEIEAGGSSYNELFRMGSHETTTKNNSYTPISLDKNQQLRSFPHTQHNRFLLHPTSTLPSRLSSEAMELECHNIFDYKSETPKSSQSQNNQNFHHGQSHTREDSAFYGQAFPSFHVLSLCRPHSATSLYDAGHRHTQSGEASDMMASSYSVPDMNYNLWYPPTTDADTISLGGYSIMTNMYRSPSCGELGSAPFVLSAVRDSEWLDNVSGLSLSPSLKILRSFHILKVPEPGEKIYLPNSEFQKGIEYVRPSVKLPYALNRNIKTSESSESNFMLLNADINQIDAEAAFGLRRWTIAVLCRSLSLDNILSLIAAAMCEKQIVFFCSNIGILTSAVLSLIPLLQPFTWQSLLMPAVPTQLLDLLDAPGPFAIGIQHKTPEVAQKCKDVVRVNLYKDKIKNAPPASFLPNYKQLYGQLHLWHRKIQEGSKYSRRPMHVVTSSEFYAVEGFSKILNKYLACTMGSIERHTITQVGSKGRVSLLLEESFVGSFNPRDQPFMKCFVDTQMFLSYVDSVLGRSPH